ncbi:MAG: S8 family serine peptidase [Phycisphaerales bacterium]
MVRGSVVVALVAFAGLAVPSHGAQPFGPRPHAEVQEHNDAPRRATPIASQIRLRGVAIDTARNRTLADSVRAEAARAPRLLQLDGPMTPARRAALERAGVRIGGYVGSGAFLADTSAATPDSVRDLGFVRWAGAMRPEWKLAPEIGRRVFETPERIELAEAGITLLHITLVGDGVGAIDQIEAIDGATLIATESTGDRTTIAVAVPAGAERKIAAIDEILFIEEAPEATTRNATVRWIVQTNQNGSTPLYGAGLTGAGQIVGVLDTKIDVLHCSFRDPNVPILGAGVYPGHRKILAFNTALGYGSHGTHVAGTVAGDNGDNTDTRGVAYDAKIVFNDLPSLSDSATGTLFGPLLELHRTQGAFIHTNSWGDDNSTSYTGWCRTIDEFMWDHEDNLVIFAESNLSTIRTPENAKNLLAVAATRDTPSQDQKGYGGVGPTADGRRKPDIMAPGIGIMSASAWPNAETCGLSSKSGTSMAAPGVAGTALLARQYFVDGYYPSGVATPSDSLVPSGALLKATLLNSAMDATGIAHGGYNYPNSSEGWGRVALDNALYLPGDSRELRIVDVWNTSPEALSTNDTAEQTIFVESPGEQLRVTMTFTDAPAEAFAPAAPVNDLDLEVISPSGVTYRGNVFSTTTAQSITGGSWDPLNNVEQVHVASPEIGAWTVRIIGRAVNIGTQGYALAVTGDLTDGVACLGDIDGDGVVNGQDLGELLGEWGQNRSAPYDLTGDGVVNGNDLGVLLGMWGPCP